MSAADIEQLVREVADLTHSPLPAMLERESPVLANDGRAGRIYLIGLIGGKEVGKSALVNALAGAKITEETSHGPGTEMVVAYAHRSHAGELSALLESAVPGRFRVVPHNQPGLGGQVLLDLPDIDSHFAEHVRITREMLRHMLFPIWIQSVEKYADAQPRNLLTQVAAGNDPGNFLFCLNKADQLSPADADELRSDFARRLAVALSLKSPPRVFLISARDPKRFDLPDLAAHLSRERTARELTDARDQAARQRARTLLAWLRQQDIPAQAARLRRLEDNAAESLDRRLATPLAEEAASDIVDDPAYRAAMTDGVFARRVARWPIVNILHAILSPLQLLVRHNVSPQSFGGPEALVAAHLSIHGQPVALSVQSTFAHLHQSDPAVAECYQRGKPWEAMDAAVAESKLRNDWVETIQRQRETVLARLSGRTGLIAPLIRILLTIGALFWFPLIQPALHVLLTTTGALSTARGMSAFLIEAFSTASLLTNGIFLLLWYLLIWALLRWHTHHRVDRLLGRWKRGGTGDSLLNLNDRIADWIDDLLEPIRSARERLDRLAERIGKAEKGEADSGK